MINSIELTIWDRVFNLSIEFDCYQGETATNEQLDAVSWFSSNKRLIEKGKKAVEKFCRKQLVEDADNKNKNNVFSYVKPEYLYVKREKQPRVAIMCKYRYDLEHGLAVVFSQNDEVIVGIQDIIL